MIKYVFLDLDDTILDFHAAEAAALSKTLKAYGIEPTEAVVARYSEINDAQWKRLERGELTRIEVKRLRFAILFEELGVTCDSEAIRLCYEQNLAVGHYFMPGAERLLADLRSRGYALYLVSNGTTAVQIGRMASAGIEGFFEKIFFSEAIGYVKPQREFFDACFAEIPNFDPAEAIILGDSLTSDILGGIQAGMRTCWYRTPHQAERPDIRPDYVIDSLADFCDLLDCI